MVILFLLLIQEGQLSVSGERMCTSTSYRFRGLSLPRKTCGQLLNMILMGWLGHKTSTQTNGEYRNIHLHEEKKKSHFFSKKNNEKALTRAQVLLISTHNMIFIEK